jgi:cytochrome c-type biogenesis protein CcmH/NrfG
VRLLEFYDFRNDATNMVSVGKELLVATPDDIGYLDVVARGYMLMGDFENGVGAYNKILSIDDENYDALIAMGNYFYVMWKESEGTRSQMTSTKVQAQEYLQKAYNLRPTPFVKAKLTELEAQ